MNRTEIEAKAREWLSEAQLVITVSSGSLMSDEDAKREAEQVYATCREEFLAGHVPMRLFHNRAVAMLADFALPIQRETYKDASRIVIDEIMAATGPKGGWIYSPKALSDAIRSKMEQKEGE